VSWFLANTVYISSCQADGDTLFLFNYRSDRMREISTVLGQLDKPTDVVVPKDLVRFLCTIVHIDLRNWTAHNYHVSLQLRVPVPSRLPASSDDKRARRVALQKRHQGSAYSRSVMRINQFSFCHQQRHFRMRTKRPKSMRMSHSSSMAASRSSSREKNDI